MIILHYVSYTYTFNLLQKSIFNLPSTDDILTHKGQLLMDVDRYEDPRDGSDSEDERLNGMHSFNFNQAYFRIGSILVTLLCFYFTTNI